MNELVDQSLSLSILGLNQNRLEKPHQIVTMKNHDEKQAFVVRDRHYRDVVLKPGEVKEVDIISDEIAGWVHLAREDRGFYEIGPNAGKPFPVHPVRIIAGI